MLLALAAAAYFVLRGPSRAQSDPVNQTAAAAASPAPSNAPAASNAQDSDAQRKAAEARLLEEQKKAAAAAEAKRLAAEAASKEESKPATSQKPPAVAPLPTPRPPQPEPERPAPSEREGCLFVSVVDKDGEPLSDARIGVFEQSGRGQNSRFSGRTGPNGHFRQCGLTNGHYVRVVVFGYRGSSQEAIIAGRTAVNIRVGEKRDYGERRREMDDKRKDDDDSDRHRDRRGTYRRRPDKP
jgi:hypothetical protein